MGNGERGGGGRGTQCLFVLERSAYNKKNSLSSPHSRYIFYSKQNQFLLDFDRINIYIREV